MPASGTIYGLRGIWTENDASGLSVHPRMGGASKERLNGRKLVCVTSTETAILVWLALGAGIAGGVFIVARSAVQIGSVAYRVMEKQTSGRPATRRTSRSSVPSLAGAALPNDTRCVPRTSRCGCEADRGAARRAENEERRLDRRSRAAST